MNIVYVLPEFVTEKAAGGLATYYDNISRMLADAGHTITIFVESDITQSLDYYSGIKVEKIKVEYPKSEYDIPGAYIRMASMHLKEALLARINKGEKFDLVQYPNFMGYGIERVNLPTVIRASSFRPYLRMADQEEFDIHKKYNSIKIPDFIEDIAVMKADAIYSPSNLMADVIYEQTGKDVSVIESPFYPHEESAILPEDIKKVIRNKKYILTFGSLKALKGAKVIGDTIYSILERCKDIYWIFAGAEMDWVNSEGEKISPSLYILKHAKEYSNRVIILGKVKQEFLFPIISGALFCVMPSRIDNLPNTCIEAMALQKIVIGTIGASFEQLIEDGVNGFLIERENSGQLLNAVEKAYKLSTDELYQMGRKAKMRIDRMAPEINIEQLISFYEKVIENYDGRIVFDKVKYKETVNKINTILSKCANKGAKKYMLPLNNL